MKKFIEDYCFSVTLNMNDVFYPAADAETLYVDNIEYVVELEEKYGPEGIFAFVSVKRQITDFNFYSHKRGDSSLNKLKQAQKLVYEMIRDKKIDTYDWSKEANDKFNQMGLIPVEEELIDWFHNK